MKDLQLGVIETKFAEIIWEITLIKLPIEIKKEEIRPLLSPYSLVINPLMVLLPLLIKGFA